MKRLCLSWLLLASFILLVLVCEQPRAQISGPDVVSQAASANSFVESIGINTHVNYDNTAYGNYAGLVKPSLLYLGVRHIRDGLADDNFMLNPYRDLHNEGIKLTGLVPYKTESMAALIAMIKMQRDVLEAVEGPNETDEFTQFTYQGQSFPKGTIAFMKDFYPAIKNDPNLRDLPVLQTTLAFPGKALNDGTRASSLGDLSAYADYGNSHNYFSFGEAPSSGIKNDHLPLNSSITPGKPMMSSEGGYQMGDGDGYKGTWDDGQSAPFSEDVHGRYILRYALEQYRLGYERSFIYELLDSDQPQWGLFRADGTPKPAAYGLGSMIKILSEANWDNASKNWVVPDFTPGRLKYSLAGAPSSIHTLLLQKSDGRFYLIIWNEITNWDSVTGTPVLPANVSATLKINEAIRQTRIFLPLMQGTVATVAGTSTTIPLSIPDQPLIVEITLR
jgi:hypothetical protein